MKTYDFLSRERYASVAYSSPAVDVFSYFSEGVLCASYGDPNAPGNDLNQENEWDF